MAGPLPIPVNLAGLLPPGLTQAGQSFRGVVAELSGALVIRSGNATIPLSPTAGLAAGQNVFVRITQAGPNPQLQVTPTSLVVTSSSVAKPVQGTVVAQGNQLAFAFGGQTIKLPVNQTLFAAGDRAVFQPLAGNAQGQGTLTHVSGASPVVTAAAPLSNAVPVPPVIANTPAGVEVQALLANAGGLGPAIAGVQSAVAHVAPGVVPSDIGAAFAAVFAPLLKPDAEQLAEGIKRWIHRNAQSTESALAKGQSAESPRAVLERLQQDPALRQLLSERGELRAFDGFAERVAERLSGGQLQNLRSIEQPYWFAELPFDPETGIERVFVHFFGEERGGRRDGGEQSVSVSIDVTLSNLGDVWVKLAMVGGHCACTISVRDDEAFALVNEYAGDLEQALASTGAQHVAVHAERWDGDRVQRTAAALQTLDGMDLSA